MRSMPWRNRTAASAPLHRVPTLRPMVAYAYPSLIAAVGSRPARKKTSSSPITRLSRRAWDSDYRSVAQLRARMADGYGPRKGHPPARPFTLPSPCGLEVRTRLPMRLSTNHTTRPSKQRIEVNVSRRTRCRPHRDGERLGIDHLDLVALGKGIQLSGIADLNIVFIA